MWHRYGHCLVEVGPQMFVSVGGSPDQYDNAQVPILHHDDDDKYNDDYDDKYNDDDNDDDDWKHNCRFIQRQVGGWQWRGPRRFSQLHLSQSLSLCFNWDFKDQISSGINSCGIISFSCSLYQSLICYHLHHYQSRYGHGCVPFKWGNDTAILVAGNNFSPADLSEVMTIV